MADALLKDTGSPVLIITKNCQNLPKTYRKPTGLGLVRVIVS